MKVTQVPDVTVGGRVLVVLVMLVVAWYGYPAIVRYGFFICLLIVGYEAFLGYLFAMLSRAEPHTPAP